jgi:hypothetical protein
MEKIMSKTNDTSRLAFEDHDRKSTAAADGSLRDAELTDVTGGSFDFGNIVAPVASHQFASAG